MNAKEREKAEAREFLLQQIGIKPGDTIYTSLEHVSRSGMYRVIKLFHIQNNEPFDISYMAAKLLEGYDERHNGCRAGGCGMDMGFHLVYSLAWALFGRDGYECLGEKCPASDHVNNWEGPRGAGVIHTESGYALRQKWL